MRLDDPRLAGLAAATAGLSAVVSFVEESADHRLFIAAALLEDGERPARPPQALPADLRAVRRAAVLRRGRQSCGRCRRGWASASGSAICEDFWHLTRAPAPRPRRRPDPGQRLVVARPRPGRDQRGRPRDGDLVADPDADVRPADDVVRGVLQPGRRRRVDLVLGRLRGDRPDRPGAVQRAALRRRPVRRRRAARRTSAASGWRCRCCATSGPSSRSAS